MPRSEAQKRADKKYHNKTFKSFTINTKVDDYNIIDDYCKSNNISKTKAFINAFKYCIDNNIDISSIDNNTTHTNTQNKNGVEP